AAPAGRPSGGARRADARGGGEGGGRVLRARAPRGGGRGGGGGGGRGGQPARRLAALLLLGWGQAARAWALFEGTLGPPTEQAAMALRQFADRAAALPGSEAKRVRGQALARYADLVPPPLAGRARADAAR